MAGERWVSARSTSALRYIVVLSWVLLRELTRPRSLGRRRRCFGYGAKWVGMLGRLVLFALALAPAFAQMVWFYFTSARVRRGIPYGANRRNDLDVYLPTKARGRRRSRGGGGGESAEADAGERGGGGGGTPVLIFFTGGAWIIGYKAPHFPVFFCAVVVLGERGDYLARRLFPSRLPAGSDLCTHR